MTVKRFFNMLPIAITIALILATEGIAAGILIVSAAIIHECGHMLALVLSGNHVAYISPRIMGLSLVPARPMSYIEEFFVCISGPLANIVTALFLIAHIGGDGAFFFFSVNLLLAAVNLLPVFSLDGGRAIRALISIASPATADICMHIMSLSIWSFLWFSSLFFCGAGYASPMICILLLSILISSKDFFYA